MLFEFVADWLAIDLLCGFGAGTLTAMVYGTANAIFLVLQRLFIRGIAMSRVKV